MMRLMPAANCLVVKGSMCSAVTRFMHHEMLTKNGTPIRKIMFTVRVTHWCHSRISLVISM
jgi:hypothetical protein